MPAQINAAQITVLLVDDHAVVRDGLRMILESADDIKIIGEAENGHEAVRKAVELKPRVIMLDVAMPLLSGAETARQISEEVPAAKILVLSTYGETQVVRDLIGAGVSGYLTKDTASAQLLDAIRAVARGDSFFSPAISKLLLEQSRQLRQAPEKEVATARLTSREAEVLQLVAEGHANKHIADILKISIKTVEKHRQSVMAKLNIHETATLTRYAVAKRIVQCDRLPTSDQVQDDVPPPGPEPKPRATR